MHPSFNKSLEPEETVDIIFTDDLILSQVENKYSFKFVYLGEGVFLLKSSGYIDEKSFRIQMQYGEKARERLKEIHPQVKYHLIWDFTKINGISLISRSLMFSKITVFGVITSITIVGANTTIINFSKVYSKLIPWVRFFYYLTQEEAIENLNIVFHKALRNENPILYKTNLSDSFEYFLKRWKEHSEFLTISNYKLRIIRNELWNYISADNTYSVKVSVVEGNIFYFECEGFANIYHIEQTYGILESVIRELEVQNTDLKFYSVLNIRKLKGITLSARRLVAKFENIYREKIQIVIMIPSPVMRMLLRIFHMLDFEDFYHWEMMSSVDDSFERVLDYRAGHELNTVKQEFVNINNDLWLIPEDPSDMVTLIRKQQKEIEQLKKNQKENIDHILEITGRMTWDESFSEDLIINKSSEPFNDIYASLHVLFQDFKEILQEKTIHAQQLKESEDKYRNIVSLANDIIGVYQDGIIKFVNSRIKQVLDYEPEEFIGRNLDKLVIPEEKIRLEDFNRRRMKGEEVPWFYETVFIHKNGSHIPISMSVGTFEFENRPAVMVIARDMSLKKKNEEELERYRNHLEDIIRERTEELQKEITERKIAEDSDRLKTAFLSNMSHEIRTPMNAIISFSKFLRNINLTKEEHDEYLNYIQSSGETLLTLINDIIDISKIEANQLQLHESLCWIDPILDELFIYFDRHLRHLSKTEVQLILSIPDRTANINFLTDGYRLRQILTNLLDNSIKFTDSGIIEFGYKLVNEMIVFYVQDSGLGIPKDKLSHIFKRFGKVELTGRNLSGTGLGLAISHQLATLLHGDLKVESMENQGSTFYLELPLKQLQHNQITEKLMEASYRENYNWHNKNILIVEDEDLNFRVLQISLRNTQAKIIRAVNGKEAVEKMNEVTGIDLILMDIQMPIMDGYEALAIIKKTYPLVPIIAQTAYALMEEKKRCIEMGFDDYISKPIKFEELFAKVDRLIEKEV